MLFTRNSCFGVNRSINDSIVLRAKVSCNIVAGCSTISYTFRLALQQCE